MKRSLCIALACIGLAGWPQFVLGQEPAAPRTPEVRDTDDDGPMDFDPGWLGLIGLLGLGGLAGLNRKGDHDRHRVGAAPVDPNRR